MGWLLVARPDQPGGWSQCGTTPAARKPVSARRSLLELASRIIVRAHRAEPLRDLELLRVELCERPLHCGVLAVAAVAGGRARERRGCRLLPGAIVEPEVCPA